MRVSREQAAENRERIVATASRLFREKGFDGVGVDAIMQGAGLTHGGFYGHFKSKDDLAAEALAYALKHGNEHQQQFKTLKDFVGDYLSERHRSGCADGCAVAALGGDIVRQGKPVRRGLSAHLKSQIEHVADFFKTGGTAARRKRAIATLAGMAGALMLARAVDDPDLADEILTAARDVFGKDATA
jgi:TetR/AcrR family transcriptional repressor of nem operon